MRRVSIRSATLAALLAAAAVYVPGRPAPPPPVPPARFHAAPEALEAAVVEATLALVRDDGLAARRALDRIEDGCARISRDDDPSLSPEMASWDLGFHRQLDAIRETALRGDVEATAEGFGWVQRACRECHRQAEAEGLKPPRPVREAPDRQERQSRG